MSSEREVHARLWKSFGASVLVAKPLCIHPGAVQVWGQKREMVEGVNNISKKACGKCGSRSALWQWIKSLVFKARSASWASPSSQAVGAASSQKGPLASILDDTFWRLTRCWDEWESCSLTLLLALKTFTLSSFSIAFRMTVLKHL